MKPPDYYSSDIYDRVKRETRVSRHRDPISGERIHEVQADINRLLNFVLERRLRQPYSMMLARRVHAAVDTQALRALVDLVLTRGSFPPVMRRCCDRVIGYCRTIELALFLKQVNDVLQDEKVVQSKFLEMVRSTLDGFGAETIGEAMGQAAQVPFFVDYDRYLKAVCAAMWPVLEARVAKTKAELLAIRQAQDELEKEHEKQLKAFEEFRAMATSKTIH